MKNTLLILIVLISIQAIAESIGTSYQENESKVILSAPLNLESISEERSMETKPIVTQCSAYTYQGNYCCSITCVYPPEGIAACSNSGGVICEQGASCTCRKVQ